MLPEVEKFIEGRTEADTYLNQGVAMVNALRMHGGSIYDQHSRLEHVKRYLMDALWAQLKAELTDPLGRYLVESIRGDYPDHVVEALKMLPATLAEFDEWAQANSWCGDYRTYRDRAVNLGYFRDENQTEESFRLVSWYRDEIGTTRSAAVAEFRVLLDAAVEAELGRKLAAADAAAADDGDTRGDDEASAAVEDAEAELIIAEENELDADEPAF